MTTMSRKAARVGLLLTTLSACQPHPTGLSIEDKKAIEASSKEWVQTYNQNNWDRLASLFTPDATMMPPNHPPVQGRDAIAAWQDANETDFRIAFDLQEIRGLDNIAYVRGRSCVYIPVGDAQYGVDVGKFLEIRQKQPNGDWLITTDIFNSDAALGGKLLDACPFAVSE